MARKIETCAMTMTGPQDVTFAGDVRAWLAKNAPETADTLLAFALDGLIWGKLSDGKLAVAHDVEQECSADLNVDTLQEARLFGKSAELHLWRRGGGWRYRVVQDSDEGDARQYIEEQQMLWGDQVKSRYNGFSLMQDGVQGLRHAVPLEVPDPTPARAVKDRHGKPTNQYKERPLRLTVRHYLANQEKEPFARVELSRLVSVCAVGQKCQQTKEAQS